MSYESGSLECRKLIEAKENLIQIMQSLEYLDDADEIMPYEKGSTEFIDRNLKKAENIRLYQ